MNTFTLHLLGADRLFYEGQCYSVTVPASDGQYGVLAGHANLITAIVPGELTFTVPGDEPVTVAVAAGIMKVEDNDVLILVDSVLRPEEIDADRAREEAAAAREALMQKKSRQEYRSAQAQLARAVTKLKVRRKGSSRRI
ncbi:MAG TPA: ATP synthase F1 subunit epsilon [Candidatus Coproplasma excrementipullorum]|nr:ATP synthase F1 subunit epsilon [Candidatus Coproplasma excrementipullorum]